MLIDFRNAAVPKPPDLLFEISLSPDLMGKSRTVRPDSNLLPKETEL